MWVRNAGATSDAPALSDFHAAWVLPTYFATTAMVCVNSVRHHRSMRRRFDLRCAVASQKEAAANKKGD